MTVSANTNLKITLLAGKLHQENYLTNPVNLARGITRLTVCLANFQFFSNIQSAAKPAESD
jgi:hypothetical protein